MTLVEQIQQQVTQLPPDKQREVLDFIVFLQERLRAIHITPNETERKDQLRKAFAKLAELGTFSGIADPVEWQRQIRKDRPVPGREG